MLHDVLQRQHTKASTKSLPSVNLLQTSVTSLFCTSKSVLQIRTYSEVCDFAMYTFRTFSEVSAVGITVVAGIEDFQKVMPGSDPWNRGFLTPGRDVPIHAFSTIESAILNSREGRPDICPSTYSLS